MSDWKLARRKGIGGSDAAAILGFSPWKSPMDVYLDKKGLADDKPGDPNRQFLLELGQQLEPVIARLYERETGKQLQQPAPALWHHSRHEVLLGTPDRVVSGERGVELKSENQFQNEFGEPGTDQVPYHYLIQCAHYMALGNYPAWDVALLKGGASFAIYTIERDLELEKYLIDELLSWWDRHIVGDKLPDVDNSDAWKVFLRKKFPANLLPMKEVSEEMQNDIRKLAIARRSMDLWETERTELETRIKLAIGEHEGVLGDFGKITWKKARDGKKTDYSAALEWICNKHGVPHETRDEVLGMFTQVVPGSRRLLFNQKEGWNPYGHLSDGAGTAESTRAQIGDGGGSGGGSSESAD